MHSNRVTALPVSHALQRLRAVPGPKLNPSILDNCLLSSGAWVRIPPGTSQFQTILKFMPPAAHRQSVSFLQNHPLLF